MFFCKRKRLILILGLFLSAYLADAVQAQNRFANQQLADDVARTLRQSGKLKRYHIDIKAADGTVELLGKLADIGQRDEVIRLAKAVPGVRQVCDRLLVVDDRSIVAVQGQDEEQPEQGPPPKKLDEQQPALPAPPPLPSAPSPSLTEPMPFNMCAPNDQFMKPPPLPPYAWPTYAPYNNYSRVAYPNIYPGCEWPGIGPFYPFPKIPPGWRSVQLTWEDGYWWYGRGVNGHDWWRVRYK